MADGIRITNDFGSILVDDTYPTLNVIAQGVSTLDSTGQVYIGNYPGKVCVRAGAMVGYQQFSNAGGDGWPAGQYLFGPPGVQVEWWVYGQPQAPGSNFGLKIYSAAPNSRLMFDAGAKAARVVELRSGPGNGNWQGAIGMPGGGRKWAVLPLQAAFISKMSFTRAGAGGPDQYWQDEDVNVAGGSISGDTVTLGMTQTVRRRYGPWTGTQVPTGYTVQSQNCAMAVMDMTGY